MRNQLLCLGLLGLAACASGGRTDVATTPAPAPVETTASAAPAAPVPAVERVAPVSPVDLAVPPAPRPVTPVPVSVPDSLEDAFLDSLHTLAADSGARPRTAVAVEAVRDEVVQMFGPPPPDSVPTWDIDVASYANHERVLYWMDFFTGRSRWHFERYLERAGRYDSLIRTRLGQAGLPRDMIYLAMIESGFSQHARSRAGAVGLWQFMPATGRLYGLAVDAWVDDRRDPYRSTDAAIRFLSDLNRRFGSLYLAAAAYNGGPGRIQRGLRRNGDFGGLSRDEAFFAMAQGSDLRRETRDYVPKMIAAALLAKEPERYGFTGLQRWEPLVWDSVEVRYAVGLDVIARLAGTSRDVIEELNGRFIRGVTPPDRRVYVRLPVGSADSVAARLAVLPERERVTFVHHTVARGETLSKISRRYGVSVADLKSANRLTSSRIHSGQRLLIPTSARAVQRSAGTAGSRGTAARSTTSRSGTSTRASTTTRSSSRRVHIVRQGETLSGIAEDFRVPLSSLLQANNLTSRSTIRPGQAIRIPAR